MENSGNEILERIIQDAKEKAETIVEDAKKYAETLIAKQRQMGHQSAEKEAYSLLKRAENDADIIRGKVSMDIKRRAGWIVLDEKDRLITDVLDEVKSRLEGMQKSEEYLQVLEKLIVDAGAVLGGGTLDVLLNENDKKLPLKLGELEKRVSDRSGVKTKLRLSKQKIVASGAIVKTADDRIIVDNTFEAILRRREKELKLKIAQILFSNAD